MNTQVNNTPDPLSEAEFRHFQQFIFQFAGISLADHKRPLVAGRLNKRLRHYGLASYNAYFDFVSSDEGRNERQVMVDLLTTNETYFFREPAHFDYLKHEILPRFRQRKFRVWSAACSSGEECYTLAMVIADALGENWSILGSDISTRVLETARRGLYPINEAEGIPKPFLQRYCLKGVRSQTGYFLIDPTLKRHIEFRQINLHAPLPEVGEFDLIMLRNVMIYFNLETKRQVVQRLINTLKPDGRFIIGHAESLNTIDSSLRMIKPSIFLRPSTTPPVEIASP